MIWGAYHGIWLVLERMGLRKFYDKIGKIPSVIITFVIVVVGWVFFRIESFNDAITFISRMFAFDFGMMENIYDKQFFFTLIVAVVLAFICLLPFGKKIHDFVFYTKYNKVQNIIVWIIAVITLLFCLGALNTAGFSPFIYFRF